MSATKRATIPELQGRVLVAGLGVTGASCVRRLRRMGVNVAVVDTRDRPPAAELIRRQYPDLPLFLGVQSRQAGKSADLVLVSPGLALSHPLIAEITARGVPAWGDIELFARLATAPVAAVTGSNGKSTVTVLLTEMAARAGIQVRAGGNLGTPALDLLDDGAELYLLELSSFQLETTRSLDAAGAVVLNVSPDHQDRYADLEAYARAKARVYQGEGVQVINRDDPRVAAMTLPGRRVIGFTRALPDTDDFGLRQHRSEVWLAHGRQPLLALSELSLKGAHNIANALAALALGRALGIPMAAMIAALREFRGLPHRCQPVAEHAGVLYIDDSKGTNVAASVAAINGCSGPLVLIAGGLGKEQDFSPLKQALTGRCRAVVLLGRDGPRIRDALGDGFELEVATGMEQAVALAAALARSGDTVLLSPACASFDLFSGFEERGRRFAAAAQGLAHGH